MHLFESILLACIDEIIIFDFHSDLFSKANIFPSIGLKRTLHRQQSMAALLPLRKSSQDSIEVLHLNNNEIYFEFPITDHYQNLSKIIFRQQDFSLW